MLILAPIALALSVILSAYDYGYLAPMMLAVVCVGCVVHQVWEWTR